MSEFEQEDFVEGEQITEIQPEIPPSEVQNNIIDSQTQNQGENDGQIEQNNEIPSINDSDNNEQRIKQEVIIVDSNPQQNLNRNDDNGDDEDEFIEGEQVQEIEINPQVIMEDQQQNQEQPKQQREQSDSDEEKIQIDEEQNEKNESNNVDDDEFIEGEEIQIENQQQQQQQQQQQNIISNDEDDEFVNGEEIDQTTQIIEKQNELESVFNNICGALKCELTKQFQIDTIPCTRLLPIIIQKDPNSLNSLLQENQSENVTQNLKDAFLEQIKLYTLVWTKYQPYVELSDKLKFVVEYPNFETGAEISPKKVLSISEPIRPGLQEILELIPDYAKLLDPTFVQ